VPLAEDFGWITMTTSNSLTGWGNGICRERVPFLSVFSTT
jgi:hypothetical protein